MASPNAASMKRLSASCSRNHPVKILLPQSGLSGHAGLVVFSLTRNVLKTILLPGRQGFGTRVALITDVMIAYQEFKQ